jgi:hypothetical protein
MSKRITARERFEALSRIEEYREEWKRYEQIRASGTKVEEDQAAEVMCRRWGIKAPFPPFCLQSDELLECPTVEVIQEIPRHATPMRDNRVTQAIDIVSARRSGREPDKAIQSRPAIEGRFLYLKIDLHQPQTVIMPEIEKLLNPITIPTEAGEINVDGYGNSWRKEGGGLKKTSDFIIDKWEIFDTCRNEDTTPFKIAELRTPTTGDAVTYERQKNNYSKQAASALNNVNQIIDSIRKAAL